MDSRLAILFNVVWSGQRGSTVSFSHTTLKLDVERDAAVSGTESPLFVPKVHFFHTSGTETPLFVPVLEHHIPHSILDAGVLLAA